MKIHNVEQGSQEWFEARCGNFTASRIKDILAKTKSGYSTSRKNMIVKLALERMTGHVEQNTYTSPAMQRGTDLEAEARDCYSFEFGYINIKEVGMVTHPDFNYITCSPDGLVDNDGLVEIKCPSAMHKHVSYLQENSHAVEYKTQLQHQLMVTKKEWVDIVSYDPRFPVGLQLARLRVFPDIEYQKYMLEEIQCANTEVEKLLLELEQKKNAIISWNNQTQGDKNG